MHRASHCLFVLLLGSFLGGACNDALTPADIPNEVRAKDSSPQPQQTADATDPAQTPGDGLTELPMDWLSIQGTSIVGFGMLRLSPPEGGTGRFRIAYQDSPDGYGVTDNAQMFILPGDAFAQRPMAYGHDILAFAYEPGDAPDTPPSARAADYGYASDAPFAPTLRLSVELDVDEEATFLVAYGPWTDPDTGRPPGDRHTLQLTVTPVANGNGAGNYRWIESEAGELITSNWSHRPMLARGQPIPAAVCQSRSADQPRLYLEIRPLILYDARLARAADEPPDLGLTGLPTPEELRKQANAFDAAGKHVLATGCRDRAIDLEAIAKRRDHHLVLTPELAEKFRRVPIRWR